MTGILNQVFEGGIMLIVVSFGFLAHESGHYILGRLAGGSPYVSQFQYGFPSQIHYNSPYEMSDWQVRLAGGYVYVYLIIAGIGLWTHWKLLAAFGIAGGITISASDLNAAHHPKAWKRLTAGETVSEEDWS